MRPRCLAACLALSAVLAAAADQRVLYLTATAGYRHSDAIDASVEVMRQIAREIGALEIVHTEDLSLLSADSLRAFDAVYFFTSGELPLTGAQKSGLLEFVRLGKGFGGSHSATDTLYTWPEYGDLIGGIFDGHPWAQEAAIDVEDPECPIVAHLAPSFRAIEEFYQFRAFSRDSVRVLLTLDTRSVNLGAPGVKRADGDFALAWIRRYGAGRLFYSAFGHFPESFTSPPLRTMLRQALLWLTGRIEADAAPRNAVPAIASVRVLGGGADAFAPGALVSIAGERLTGGSSLAAAALPLPVRLAGTHVEVNGIPAPLFGVKPGEIVAQLPSALPAGQTASLTVSIATRAGPAVPLRIDAAAPAIVAASRSGGALVLYAVGLGAVDPPVPDGAPAPAAPLARTVAQPMVRVGGQAAIVFFSGLAPGLAGVYQVNAIVPADPGQPEVVLEIAGRTSAPFPAPR